MYRKYIMYRVILLCIFCLFQVFGQRLVLVMIQKQKLIYGKKQFSNVVNNFFYGVLKVYFGGYNQNIGIIFVLGLVVIQGGKKF